MKNKLIIDILMFTLMILEYSKMYMKPIFHEIIGIILVILFVIHLILNINYIKNTFKGKYKLSRTIMLIVNILFMISFLLTIIFGILSSQELLKQLNIGSINMVYLHKIISYISLVILGIHLGINSNLMFGKIARLIKSNIVLYIVSIITIVFGIYSWDHLNIWNHIIGKYGFSIVTDNLFINILEYLSIIMMITILINFIYKRIGEKNER